jgi:hypothetical protein
MRASRFAGAAAAVAIAVAIPALAQDAAPSPAVAPAATTPAATTPAPAAARPSPEPSARPRGGDSVGESSVGVVDLAAEPLPAPKPAVEYPDYARRDPRIAGRLDPIDLGLGPDPWGSASGAFVASLMRQMDTPLASRWAHIALRNALLARVAAPRNIDPVDWTAQRAFILLRMGEADAARTLVSAVDTDRYTPQMLKVAVQAALANSDPAALCPLQDGIEKAEPNIVTLVDAMCDALAGEPESASEKIDRARRRGRVQGIDLELAQKVVGAGSNTNRAVTIQWEPVDRLDSWRYGLATATGMTFPDRLIDDAPVQLRAWQASAPMIAPEDRMKSAAIATGLGVFSGQSLSDLHSLIYDATGPDELPQTQGWQVRMAFAGKDLDTRLDAMRRLWRTSDDYLQLEASRALLGRAATLIPPSADRQSDAANLIASMLAAGFDRQAARWVNAVSQMDDENADSAWAMLALGAPDGSRVDLSVRRINAFIDRDKSEGKKRSAMLVAGLAGLGRIDADTAGQLSNQNGLRIGKRSIWTRMIDRAASLGQKGTVLVMSATGLQAPTFEEIPPSHQYHAILALKRSGQDFTSRMMAAEALARI